MNNPNPPPIDWDSEFDKLAKNLRNSFTNTRIQEFLQWHLRLNQLFTSKLQFLIDKKDHTTLEYNINADPLMMEKMEAFNKNMSEYLARTEILPDPNKDDPKQP